MAGPAKPKAPPPIEKTAPAPAKPSRPKPEKTLSLDEATQRLAALDLSQLTEEDRIAAVLEIRARLQEQKERVEAPAQALARRVLLLRLWQELVKLRVVDVQSNRQPPFERISTERLFPPVEGDETEAPPIEEHAGAALEQALKPLDPKPFVPPQPEAGEQLVSVKLLEAEMIRGMKLPAGIVVDVQTEDADHLVEKGKAVRV
jgi:hypothetical protein